MTSLQEQWIGMARESPPYVPPAVWVHRLSDADPRLPEWTLTVVDDMQSIRVRGGWPLSVESRAVAGRALASVRVDRFRDVPFRLHDASSCARHVTD